MSGTGAAVLTERLREIVGGALGRPVVIEGLTRLPGGASKDTWSFSARDPDGGTRRLVLRADRAGHVVSRTRLEAVLLEAADRGGVPVPRVVVAGDDLDDSGTTYLVTDFVDGETIPRRILRDEQFHGARAALPEQCGRALAAIHAISVSEVPGLTGGDPLGQLRTQLDQLGQPHPAFELGFRWLSEHRPAASAPAVVHGDFRNGNLIVGPEGVRAVLDWELAHLGDPIEDLGWLCVKAWRFGSPLPVGGFGTIEQLVAAYEGAGGRPVDEGDLHWWIALGTLRWGIICIVQAMTHLLGAVRSVELAAIGRRVCEVESDLLELVPWSASQDGRPPVAPGPAPGTDAPWDGTPHDVPSAPELLAAVREFLESDAVGATEGRLRFHLRVAANVVGMVGRELVLGPAQAAAHARRLEALGVAGEAELAEAIRDGSLDDRLGEVADSVRATVADKLAVANPRYATAGGAPGVSG